MSTKETETSVFISYATPDRARAFEICDHLEALGHDCWIAPRNIRSGFDYGEEIIRGIERSRCFVVILSAAANDSIYVKREVERAVAKAKPVFPVRVEDVLPSPALELHLASLHFLDAWQGALREHVITLANNLSGAVLQNHEQEVTTPDTWKRSVYFASTSAGVLLLAWLLIQTPKKPDMPGAGPPPPDFPGGTIRELSPPQTQFSCSGHFGPVVRCSIGTGLNVLVRSPQGTEFVIPGGSGNSSTVSGRMFVHNTFLPWLGRGTTASIQYAEGVLSDPVTLPDIADTPAAVHVVSPNSDAPPLFYALIPHGYSFLQNKNAHGAYLFFAPQDAYDIEWTTDNNGFVRAEKMPWENVGAGPVWIEELRSEDPLSLSIRWRTPGGEWAEPAQYHIDSPSLRRASAMLSSYDLASSISCSRESWHYFPAHIRCKTSIGLPLGELFSDLHWGTDTNELHSLDDFDFSSWASELSYSTTYHLGEELPCLGNASPSEWHQRCQTYVTSSIQTECGNDIDCRNRLAQSWNSRINEAVRSALSRERFVEEHKNYFVPWREATSSTSAAHFLAVSESAPDVFFRATRVGDSAPVSVRVRVSNSVP